MQPLMVEMIQYNKYKSTYDLFEKNSFRGTNLAKKFVLGLS